MSEAQYQTILSVVHDVYLGYSTGDRPKRMEIQQVIWLRFYNHRDIKPEDTECTKGTRMQECLSKSQRGATSPEQNSWQKLESLNGNFQWKKNIFPGPLRLASKSKLLFLQEWKVISLKTVVFKSHMLYHTFQY